MSTFDGGQTGVPESGFQVDLGQSQFPEDDLANPYLNSIPEVDRNVVGKYLKGWQGNVTRRFQAIHDQYRPWQELGFSPEQAREHQALYDHFNSDPVGTVAWMVENIPEVAELFSQNFAGQGQQSGTSPVGSQSDNPWAEYLPDDFVSQFQMQNQVLQALAERVLNSDTQYQQDQEDAQLDGLLEQMHQSFGDFDEEAVLLKMYQGMEPEEAIQSWNDSIQQQINSRTSQRPPPLVMGGNGSVPQGGPDPSKLNTEDRKNFITQALLAARDQ
jgi:hypothetical protein